MAFWFTHVQIAFEVLKQLKKSNEFNSFSQIDDFLFGSIAPDIRYLTNQEREHTHEPLGYTSALEAFDSDKYSKAFIAGYETHLICDKIWAGEDTSRVEKSIYEFFNIDSNDLSQKFALYFSIDDYFQGQNSWLNPLLFSGDVFRANNFNALNSLGIAFFQTIQYKLAASLYLREPGLNTLLSVFGIRLPLEERTVSEFIDSFTPVDEYLEEFFNASVENSVKAIEKWR